MPSILSACLKGRIQSLKSITNNVDLLKMRKMQDDLGVIESVALKNKIEVTDVTKLDFDAKFISPKNADEKNKDKVILYLHGGGYICGGIKYAEGFGSCFAVKTGIKVLCAAYRLAPENKFPSAVDDVYNAYLYLLDMGYSGEQIYLVGESAGGGLCYSLCLKLKDAGITMPGKIVAISPWSDLTLSGNSSKQKSAEDPSLSVDFLRNNAKAYAGENVSDKFASPLFGSLDQMPPSLIFVGTSEILFDDSVRLAEKLSKSGSKCSLVAEEGMWHAYVLFKTPESSYAMDKIKAFLEI